MRGLIPTGPGVLVTVGEGDPVTVAADWWGPPVAVLVGVAVRVGVGVLVFGVMLVTVAVGVTVAVSVTVGVGVSVGVFVGVGVCVGVLVGGLPAGWSAKVTRVSQAPGSPGDSFQPSPSVSSGSIVARAALLRPLAGSAFAPMMGWSPVWQYGRSCMNPASKPQSPGRPFQIQPSPSRSRWQVSDGSARPVSAAGSVLQAR